MTIFVMFVRATLRILCACLAFFAVISSRDKHKNVKERKKALGTLRRVSINHAREWNRFAHML
jgi:hypothetical protein